MNTRDIQRLINDEVETATKTNDSKTIALLTICQRLLNELEEVSKSVRNLDRATSDARLMTAKF